MYLKLNYLAGCKQPRTTGSSPDSDCLSQTAGLTGARISVPAGRWLTDARSIMSGICEQQTAQAASSSWPLVDWCTISSSSWPLVDWCKIFSSGWPPVYWLQDRLSLVSACSRPPRLPVPASRRWTDARFPVPAGRWFDWCKIFSSDWPSVYWSQDRLSLVSACSRPPRLPVSASRWRTVARLPVPAGRWLTGLLVWLP